MPFFTRSFNVLIALLVCGVIGIVALAIFFGGGSPEKAPANPIASLEAPPAEQVAPATQPIEPVRAQRFVVRDGLPHVAAKLKAGDDLTVVFLGGTVAMGGGGRGYAEQVGDWLQARYLRQRFHIINAGIDRSSSEFGGARFERDVLSHKPDLVFIDFDADDARQNRGRPRPEGERMRGTERIIRKAWTADPTIDFVLLHAMNQSGLETWTSGMLPPASTVSEKVATYYGVPSVAMGLGAADQIREKTSTWGELFVDELTPTPKGHTTYAAQITAALPRLLETDSAAPHSLEKPPISDGFYLYPTTARAVPQQTPPPLVLVNGEKAAITWDMPAVGVNWIDSAEYKNPDPAAKGAVLWRLRSQSCRENGRRLNDLFSLDRSRWGPLMQWFEEYRYFNGPGGVSLVESADKQTNHFAARGNDLPIVTFIAPRSGRFIYSIRSSDVMWWGNNRAIALNVVHFPAGESRGTSVGFHKAEQGLEKKLDLAGEVTLRQGDELAFCVDTNTALTGGGAMYLNVLLSIGYFGD